MGPDFLFQLPGQGSPATPLPVSAGPVSLVHDACRRLGIRKPHRGRRRVACSSKGIATANWPPGSGVCLTSRTSAAGSATQSAAFIATTRPDIRGGNGSVSVSAIQKSTCSYPANSATAPRRSYRTPTRRCGKATVRSSSTPRLISGTGPCAAGKRSHATARTRLMLPALSRANRLHNNRMHSLPVAVG